MSMPQRTPIKTYNPKLVTRARSLRRSMSPCEYILWENCLKHQPIRFRRQRPFSHYILDFYCAKVGLVIEIDGESHSTAHAPDYDRARTEFLKKHGLHVMRFSNIDVKENLDGISREITEYIANYLKEESFTPPFFRRGG